MEDHDDGWEAKYEALQETYDELERQTVALSSNEYRITDQEITKKFRTIREGIEAWIDEIQPQDKDLFKVAYRANLRKGERRIPLSDISLPYPRLQWEESLERLETCIHIILSMVISESLKRIFIDRYPLGLNTGQRSFLNHCHQESLKQPPGSSSRPDPAKFYRWLGETLSYMKALEGFGPSCRHETKDASNRLRSQLSKWLEPKVLEKYEDSLWEKVLGPAIALHRTIRCSGKKYTFDYHAPVENPVSTESMKSDIIDVEPFTSSKRKDVKGVFGCFMPSLIVEIAFGQRNTLLVPAVLLGYNAEDLNPFPSGRLTPRTYEVYDRDSTRHDDNRHLERSSTLSYDSRATSPKPPRSEGAGFFLSSIFGLESKKPSVAPQIDASRRKSISQPHTHSKKSRSKKSSSQKSASADTSEHDDRLAASAGEMETPREMDRRRTRTFDYNRTEGREADREDDYGYSGRAEDERYLE